MIKFILGIFMFVINSILMYWIFCILIIGIFCLGMLDFKMLFDFLQFWKKMEIETMGISRGLLELLAIIVSLGSTVACLSSDF
jgi:hypothetical protein